MSSRISSNIFGSTGNNSNNSTNTNSVSISQLDKIFVNQTGDIVSGDLNLNNNKIINLKEPKENSDVATKKYVDDKSKISGDLDLKGNKLILGESKISYSQSDDFKGILFDSNEFLFKNILSGNQNSINAFNKRLTNIGTPTNNNDCITKSYSDLRIHDINMQNNRLIFGGNNFQLSQLNTQTINNFIFQFNNGRLNIMDSNNQILFSFSDTFNLFNKQIINLREPISNSDAINKSYSDNRKNNIQMNDKILQFGDISEIKNTTDRFIINYKNNFSLMNENNDLEIEILPNTIDCKNKKLTNIKDPENDLDACNKKICR